MKKSFIPFFKNVAPMKKLSYISEDGAEIGVERIIFTLNVYVISLLAMFQSMLYNSIYLVNINFTAT